MAAEVLHLVGWHHWQVTKSEFGIITTLRADCGRNVCSCSELETGSAQLRQCLAAICPDTAAETSFTLCLAVF